MAKMVRRIEKIASHRNGVVGNPFYVVLFVANDGTRKGANMVATVFTDVEYGTAVLDRDLLASGTIEFGVNSFRGDHYDAELRAAIEKWEDDRDRLLSAVISPLFR